MVKRSLRAALSFLLAAFLLYLFSRHLDLGEILRHMKEARPGWLAAAVLLQGLHLTLRSLRWRLLLSPMKKRIRFYNLFSATAIGYLLSFVLFRIGEVVRPLMLGQRERISKSGALATIVLERLMDFLTVALLLGFYMLFRFNAPVAPEGIRQMAQIRHWALVLGVLTLASFPLLYGIVHYRRRVIGFLDHRLGAGALLPRVLHAFLGGFDVVKGGGIFARAWAHSIAIWLSISTAIWVSLEAFDLGVDWVDSLLMLALLTFGIAMPTPGAVGSFEYFGQLGLTRFFAVEPNRAAAAILVTHAFAVGPVIIAGIVLLWKDGLSLRGLAQMGRQAKPAVAPADSGGGSVPGAGR